MEAAKRFALWKEQSPTEWLRAANRFLPPAVSGALVIAIAYQLATLTWTMAPGESWDVASLPVVAPVRPTGGAGAQTADYAVLKGTHLFGEAPPPEQEAPPPVEEALDAPDTTLSLRLTGITYVEDDERKSVGHIVSDRGREKVYSVGQTIENAGGATVHSIYKDRVILNRGGRLEALRLPKETATGTVARAPSPMPAATPQASSPGTLREAISANASRLTDILRIAPHVDGGQVVGFRVTPGRDREAFTALGLQPGDVVTDINGTVLNDASRGLEAFEALGESTMANVTVLRDGVPQVLVIDMSQIQTLQENRE
ncbi:MAG TPA: type II secretion system protein GspC [Gammaproteobacteria bacterium]